MCGIVGVVSNCSNGFTQKEADTFSDLLFLDTMRGFDSTGVVGVDNSGNVTVIKEASHSIDFMDTKEYKELRTDMIRRGKIMVGHNRAATRGTIVDKNAHPFVVDDKIVLMQNGTYKGSHHHHKVTDVDTEAVAHVIAENENLATALQSINASYTLAWYNADTYTLNLIRNEERPMWIAFFGLSGAIFASEPDFIVMAANRNDLKLKAAPISIKPGTLTSFTLDLKGSYVYEEKEVDYKFKSVAPFHQTNQNLGLDCAYSPHRGARHTAPVNLTAIGQATSEQIANRAYGAGGVRELKFDFITCIAKNHPQYMYDKLEQAEEEVSRISKAGHQGYHYVEVVDYIPANDHKNCEVFHVYGSVLDPHNTEEGACCLVHWISYSKKEEDVIDDITKNSFYKVKLSTNMTRKIPMKIGAAKYIQAAFALQHEPIENITAVQQ